MLAHRRKEGRKRRNIRNRRNKTALAIKLFLVFPAIPEIPAIPAEKGAWREAPPHGRLSPFLGPLIMSDHARAALTPIVGAHVCADLKCYLNQLRPDASCAVPRRNHSATRAVQFKISMMGEGASTRVLMRKVLPSADTS